MDLKDPSGSTEDEKKKGERMVTASSLYTLAEPVLIASSIIPVVDPCTPGGRGYVNAISPFTGARLYLPLFDINDDNSFDDDQLDGAPIGGVDLGVGMPSEPVLVGDRLVVGGSAGNVEDTRVNTGAAPIRGRVSWDQIIKD